MELINKRHGDITSNQRVDLAAYFKMENERVVYFSAGASIAFGLMSGLYMHFQNDDDRWYFYCNDDTDGFPLISRSGKNSILICDASLVKLICKRTKKTIGTKYLIQSLNSRFKGIQLMEILFNKPLD